MSLLNSHQPLVSVIIPAYNAEAFIAETLKSVLSQSYKNIEVLVVDDGSQDRTHEIVRSFAETDFRITLLQQPNKGVAAARNLAIEKSSGEYIAPIDADDIWYPQNLEKQVQCMLQSEPSVGLVYAWSAYINEQGLLIGVYKAPRIEGDVYFELVPGNFIGSASAPLIRRACFEKVGDYNCKLKEQNAQGCEDWDIYLRIAECYQFRVVPEFLIGYRQVIGSMSCKYQEMLKSHSLMMADAQQRNPKIPTTLYQWSCRNFYWYLAEQSRRCGNHGSTIVWLYRTLQQDPINFLNYQGYKLLLTSFLKLIAQPLTSIIWPTHNSWVQFKRMLKSRLKPKRLVITFSDLNRQVSKDQQPHQNLYTRILSRRLPKAIENINSYH